MKSKGTIFGIRHEETQMSTVKTLNSNWGQAMCRQLLTYRDKPRRYSSVVIASERSQAGATLLADVGSNPGAGAGTAVKGGRKNPSSAIC